MMDINENITKNHLLQDNGQRNFFPLQFINQILISLTTEKALYCIRNTSYLTADETVSANINNTAWAYTLADIVLHYTVVVMRGTVAQSADKAYLANGLPDLMHSISTYNFQFQPVVTGTSKATFDFTLSGTSYE